MKELTIEQKAQRYDEALDRAKKLYEQGTITECLGHVFPELKESEGENIKHDIIEFIKRNKNPFAPIPSDITLDKWIAWLEKQSTPQVRTGLEWVNTIDDACDKRYAEEYAHGEYCHEQSFKWGFQEGVDWLEKQGESKFPEDLGEYIAELSKQFPEVSFAKLSRIAVRVKNWLEKQGEQKSIWHREDEQNLNACLGYIPDEFLRRWLQDAIHVKYDKHAWSEEDEINLEKTIWYVENPAPMVVKDSMLVEWLKSLKQRIGG